MDLHIGVTHTPKELDLEVDGTADDIVAAVDAALEDSAPMVWFTDVKGRRVGILAAKIAYVDIAEDGANKRVGFGR
jgi:Protein of unknown function (DUF3107)